MKVFCTHLCCGLQHRYGPLLMAIFQNLTKNLRLTDSTYHDDLRHLSVRLWLERKKVLLSETEGLWRLLSTPLTVLMGGFVPLSGLKLHLIWGDSRQHPTVRHGS